MKNYTDIEIKAMRQELALLEKTLSEYLHGEPASPEPVPALSAEDTDRLAAEKAFRSTVEQYDMVSRPLAASGEDYARLQEDQRIRRDANIARQGHKRLMQGCYETAWRRTLKLEKELGDAK